MGLHSANVGKFAASIPDTLRDQRRQLRLQG